MKTDIKKFLEGEGLTVLPDSDQWKNRFEIHSETSDRVYIIAQRANQSEWGCSCPSWRVRRTCKHLNSILPLLEKATKLKQLDQ